MTVIDLRKRRNDLRNTLNYLDSCMFTKDNQDSDKDRILALFESGVATFAIPRSVKDEVDHPNTPLAAKNKADGMFFTFSVIPSPDEQRKKELVYAILIGNAINPIKHRADANHILEAGIHHGYFITTEIRILNRKNELQVACGVRVISPADWLIIWDEQNPC